MNEPSATRYESEPLGYTVGPIPTQDVDPGLYRVVVYFLGTVSMLVVVGALVLTFFGKAAPDGVIAIGGMAIGAFAGLIVPRGT